MHDREESAVRSRGDLLLTTLSLGLPVAVYNLLLIERKYSVVLGRGAFLQEPLVGRERILYPIVLAAEVTLLVLTAAAFVRALLRRLAPGRAWTGVAGFLAAAAYFVAVTVEFDVYRYFRDGIDMGVARDLGGGDLSRALAFVKAEMVGLLPLVVGVLVAAAGWMWAWRRYGSRISGGLGGSRFGRLASRRGILLASLALLLLPGAALFLPERFARALGHIQAHRVYRVALAYGTDFDGDGFGLLTRPFDHAPFDSTRHPYAKDLPGNGIDENGIAGDLPRAAVRDPMPAWDPALLSKKNVLLVVLETARRDLLDTEVEGKLVMPHLATVPGQRLRAISHFGFTGPAICGILNGTLGQEERGTSLIDRFRALGYATAVFSGQPEDFSDIAEHTGMERADVRWDAARFPREKRMYTGAALSSLVMPGDLVVEKFVEWTGTLGSRPFFAYVNLQEMHFPYASPKIPFELPGRPIPRDQITAGNREWLLRTYCNAARRVDTVLAKAFASLRERGVFEDTVILVVGDHGEELFHHGFLGHGVDITHEQNETFLKLVNGAIEPPAGPIGLCDIGRVLFNLLVLDPKGRLPIGGPVLAMVGGARSPRQIGLFDEHGLRKYDFIADAWTREDRPGAPPRPADEDPAVIHAWESYAWSLR
ncbi:MAG: sulfatase-like hydrolase/transferase [Planctomycetota bacterium]